LRGLLFEARHQQQGDTLFHLRVRYQRPPFFQDTGGRTSAAPSICLPSDPGTSHAKRKRHSSAGWARGGTLNPTTPSIGNPPIKFDSFKRPNSVLSRSFSTSVTVTPF